MATSTRTDIHRPSAPEFDPAKYNLVNVYYLGPSVEGMREERLFDAQVAKLESEGYRRGGNPGGCAHCGANIMYVALMIRPDVQEWIIVGETCLDHRFSSTKAAFGRMRAKVTAARKEAKIVKAYRELCATHPVVAYASYSNNIASAGLGDTGGRVGMAVTYDRDGAVMTFGPLSGKSWALDKITEMHASARRYGTLSEKQIAFLTKLMAELDEAHTALATREPEPEPEPGVPAIKAGRYLITGEIVSTKWQDNDFGSSLKILILTANGQRFWGTAPAALNGELKGRMVSLTGTVKRSDKDAGFGFYARPAGATFI